MQETFRYIFKYIANLLISGSNDLGRGQYPQRLFGHFRMSLAVPKQAGLLIINVRRPVI